MSNARGLVVAIAVAAAGVVGAVVPFSAAIAGAQSGLIQFAPHRAVYEVTLERSSAGSGVVEVVGRMVYELNGSRCEGFTQNMRFVTRMVSQDGTEQLNDLRTSSWEDGEGKRLRFNSEQYRDSKLVEMTVGDAQRSAGSGPITVKITQPEKQTLEVDPANLFPMQHSTALLTAAEKGQRQLVAGLYDGSDKGQKVYQTSAWIGAKRAAGKEDNMLAGLAKQASWPVSIAYYDPGSEDRDALPAYELSFHIFENGVTSDMMIDYGEFAVRGALKELTFTSKTDCEVGAGTSGETHKKHGESKRK